MRHPGATEPGVADAFRAFLKLVPVNRVLAATFVHQKGQAFVVLVKKMNLREVSLSTLTMFLSDMTSI